MAAPITVHTLGDSSPTCVLLTSGSIPLTKLCCHMHSHGKIVQPRKCPLKARTPTVASSTAGPSPCCFPWFPLLHVPAISPSLHRNLQLVPIGSVCTPLVLVTSTDYPPYSLGTGPESTTEEPRAIIPTVDSPQCSPKTTVVSALDSRRLSH